MRRESKMSAPIVSSGQDFVYAKSLLELIDKLEALEAKWECLEEMAEKH